MPPELSGYWQTFNNHGAQTLPLINIPHQYTDVIIAFVAPNDQGVLYFIGPNVPTRRDVEFLQMRGQHVLLSIGGGGITVTLDTTDKVVRFSDSLFQLINTLGVDGIDINVEQGMPVSGSPYQPNGTALGLIEGLERVLYLLPSNFLLTLAPQVFNFVGGMSQYGGEWGNYLPLILHFNDRITRVHMQYYNSIPMIGLDGQIYEAGTVDFIVAMTNLIIQGFSIADTGTYYYGLPSYKVSIGLPATPQAATNGYLSPIQINEAYSKLLTTYDYLGGLMTWSIQWDSMNNYNFMRNGNYILQTTRIRT